MLFLKNKNIVTMVEATMFCKRDIYPAWYMCTFAVAAQPTLAQLLSLDSMCAVRRPAPCGSFYLWYKFSGRDSMYAFSPHGIAGRRPAPQRIARGAKTAACRICRRKINKDWFQNCVCV